MAGVNNLRRKLHSASLISSWVMLMQLAQGPHLSSDGVERDTCPGFRGPG